MSNREGLGTTKFTTEIDIDRGLDFPIYTSYMLKWKSCKLKYKNIDCFPVKILVKLIAVRLQNVS